MNQVTLMTDIHRLSLELARKEKRLRFWRDRFNQQGISEEKTSELNSLLDTYSLLISKLSKDTDEHQRSETESRIAALERRFTSLYEEARLVMGEIVTVGQESFRFSQ